MVYNVPAHEKRYKQAGESAMLVAIPFDDSLNCSLKERWEALDSHVRAENEGSEIEIIARQFHSYNRDDGYVYKIWYKAL